MKTINTRISHGFTIVELLIVIVVIAILAAITIVAFNGVTERARMSGALSFEQQLRKKYLADATGNWSFDECTGSSVKNNGSVANSDTITGTATWITDTPTGSGCALNFNGATRIETLANLGATSYVKAAWVRMTTCTGSNIISQAAVNGAQSAIYAPSCKIVSGHNGTWNSVQSPSTVNDGKWHYIATIWENGTLTLYIDGKNVSSAAVGAPTTSTGVVSIGAHMGGTFLNGDLDNPFVAAQ